jgi:hypothetical protein
LIGETDRPLASISITTRRLSDRPTDQHRRCVAERVPLVVFHFNATKSVGRRLHGAGSQVWMQAA